MDGRDLSKLLKQPWASLGEPMILVNTLQVYGSDAVKLLKTGKNPQRRGGLGWVMIRKSQYKYIRYLKEGCMEELYDLKKDPDELVNLAQAPERAELLKSLRNELLVKLNQHSPEFVDALPVVK